MSSISRANPTAAIIIIGDEILSGRTKDKNIGWLAEQLTDDTSLAKVAKLMSVADGLGCSVAQLAIAWCLKNPNVSTVITGASRASQVTENMAAMEVVEAIDEGVMAKIEAAIA